MIRDIIEILSQVLKLYWKPRNLYLCVRGLYPVLGQVDSSVRGGEVSSAYGAQEDQVHEENGQVCVSVSLP